MKQLTESIKEKIFLMGGGFEIVELDEIPINEWQCENCGKIYDQDLKICEACGYV